MVSNKLNKKNKLKFHLKFNDYKINKLKNLLMDFGESEFKINKKEADIIVKNLNEVSRIRAYFAHLARGGNHDYLLELRRLLFGSRKEEEGLLYKTTKYRNI